MTKNKNKFGDFGLIREEIGRCAVCFWSSQQHLLLISICAGRRCRGVAVDQSGAVRVRHLQNAGHGNGETAKEVELLQCVEGGGRIG
uniref:Uncharacterized protein n=1 Tax=Globodera rostochiensis TaxID=31243 RepID=A0A914GZX5_GLORO